MFQQALTGFGMKPATVVPYRDLLADSSVLRKALEYESGSISNSSELALRIESPGENSDVEKLLIARGVIDSMGSESEQISRSAALRLKLDHGRIRYPAQYFRGFCSLLNQIQAIASEIEGIRLYQRPSDIELAFDKPRCHQYLAERGIPVAPSIRGALCFESLLERMRSLGWKRVFVKLATSSSASGVVALYADKTKLRAVTSMEMIGVGARTKFYNNLKLRVYVRLTDIRRLLNYLFAQGAHVEQWLPRAMLTGHVFDLRIVIVAGVATHCVVRTSKSPITNLHLGNARGNLVELKQRIGTSKWQSILDVAQRSATQFEGLLYVGTDVLIQPGYRKPTILEINAFGDLLPGVLYEGRNTYQSEIFAMTRQQPKL